MQRVAQPTITMESRQPLFPIENTQIHDPQTNANALFANLLNCASSLQDRLGVERIALPKQHLPQSREEQEVQQDEHRERFASLSRMKRRIPKISLPKQADTLEELLTTRTPSNLPLRVQNKTHATRKLLNALSRGDVGEETALAQLNSQHTMGTEIQGPSLRHYLNTVPILPGKEEIPLPVTLKEKKPEKTMQQPMDRQFDRAKQMEQQPGIRDDNVERTLPTHSRQQREYQTVAPRKLSFRQKMQLRNQPPAGSGKPFDILQLLSLQWWRSLLHGVWLLLQRVISRVRQNIFPLVQKLVGKLLYLNPFLRSQFYRESDPPHQHWGNEGATGQQPIESYTVFHNRIMAPWQTRTAIQQQQQNSRRNGAPYNEAYQYEG